MRRATTSAISSRIRPELAAQRFEAPPNPMLARLRDHLDNEGLLPFERAADQGCGKLRNLRVLGPFARELYLVDIPDQLGSTVVRKGRRIELTTVAREWSTRSGVRILTLTADDFARSRLQLDAVLSICVMDVVPAALRRKIIRTARRNLRAGGRYLVVVPRNDTSITSRCTRHNRYGDGHVFANRGALTFYRNFDRTEHLVRTLRPAGFELEADLSLYRYVVLVMRA